MSTGDGDLVAAIEAAIGCQQCAKPLGASPSGDFCDEVCQRAWHAARADAPPEGELVALRGFSLEIIRFENGPHHGQYLAVAAPHGQAFVPEATSRSACNDEQGCYFALYRLITYPDGRRVYLFERAARLLPLPEGIQDVFANLGRAASAAAQGFADLARVTSPPDGA